MVQAEQVSANAPASLEQKRTSELCVQPGSQGKGARPLCQHQGRRDGNSQREANNFPRS